MTISNNSALIVIDAQNKYRKIMSKKEINNMKLLLDKFHEKKVPIYFTQWSRCKYKHNCTRKHKHETIHNILAYKNKKNRFSNLYKLEKTRKYKCPGEMCNILKELKQYSHKKNTFVSDKMDALSNKKIYTLMKKKNIKNLYIIGGWGSHCILSTAFGCINNYNIMPHIVKDAVFDMKEFKHAVPIIVDSIIPGCNTKDIIS